MLRMPMGRGRGLQEKWIVCFHWTEQTFLICSLWSLRVKSTPWPAKWGSMSVINNAEEEGLGVIVLYGFQETVIIAEVTDGLGS